jgi:hypothetical protein
VTSSAHVLNGTTGYVDYIRAGGSYRVCANVADVGSFASGILSVTADVANITSGATAVPLSPGSFTCEGNAFNYRSAELTADGGLDEGTPSFQVTATDNAGNTGVTAWSVNADNTRPGLTGLATTNGPLPNLPGLIEAEDSLSLTLSEDSIDLNRIIAGWTGADISVSLVVFNGGGGNEDSVVICAPAGIDCQGQGQGTDNLLGWLDLNDNAYIVGSTSTERIVCPANLSWSAATRTFTVVILACYDPSGFRNLNVGLLSTAEFEGKDGDSIGGLRDKAGNRITSDRPTETSLHF